MASWAAAAVASATSTTAVDCPLRDQKYSIDSPLLDLLLKPQAKAVLNRELAGRLDKMPAAFDQPPTFAAIMTVRASEGMLQLPQNTLKRINDELMKLPITAADRVRRCARYDQEPLQLTVPAGKPRILVFEKINGFRDGPSVAAAGTALRDMARRGRWSIVFTDKGGALNAHDLQQFDAVIWNNVSGDVLTLSQRRAFRQYIERGGGFVGIHGAGGDPVYFWDWYVESLIGARFLAHPMNPQFQDAQVLVDDDSSALVRELAPGFTMNDEWYSFKNNPRAAGAHVLLKLDEGSYSPVFALPGMPEQNLKMGDHPIAWLRCVGNGRSFYSAIGHRPQTYSDPHYVSLLEKAIVWAAGQGSTGCRDAREGVQ